MEDDTPMMDAGNAALGASGNSPSEDSVLDALTAQRLELAAGRETFIPIPGYEKSGMMLMARYSLLDGKESAEIGKRISREFSKGQTYERNLYGSIDVMIAACTGVFVDRDGIRTQLKHEGIEVDGFNERLGEALRCSTRTAREVVLGVFANNIYAVQQHSLMLGRWMSNTDTDVIEEFLDQGNL